MDVESAVSLTDIGQVMAQNEDAVLEVGDVPLFAVADGSRSVLPADVTLSVLSEHGKALQRHAANIREREDSSNRLAMSRFFEEVLNRANRAVLDAAETQSNQRLAATVVAATVVGRFAYIAHVGNSRAYLFREGKLKLLTIDHTIAMLQLRRGEITREEFAQSPFRKRLTQAIGAAPHVNPDIAEVRLMHGDLVFLCSDGLHQAISHTDVSAALGSDMTLDGMARSMIAQANAAGGRDNISVVLFRVAAETQASATAADDTADVARTLGKVFLFERLSETERLLIAPYFEYQSVAAGEAICKEGEEGDSFFVFISGAADVTLGNAKLTELGSGDYAGEISLARAGRRTATITATRPTELFTLSRKRFLELTRRRPNLGLKLAIPLLDNVGSRVVDIEGRMQRIGKVMMGNALD